MTNSISSNENKIVTYCCRLTVKDAMIFQQTVTFLAATQHRGKNANLETKQKKLTFMVRFTANCFYPRNLFVRGSVFDPTD